MSLTREQQQQTYEDRPRARSVREITVVCRYNKYNQGENNERTLAIILANTIWIVTALGERLGDRITVVPTRSIRRFLPKHPRMYIYSTNWVQGAGRIRLFRNEQSIEHGVQVGYM